MHMLGASLGFLVFNIMLPFQKWLLSSVLWPGQTVIVGCVGGAEGCDCFQTRQTFIRASSLEKGLLRNELLRPEALRDNTAAVNGTENGSLECCFGSRFPSGALHWI